MSEETWRAGKLKHVFLKASDKKLIPNNFGKCLLDATTTGLCSKEYVARLLETDVPSIKKVGDSLKPRKISSVSRALVDSIGAHLV
ncbi:MAG TPA: hypothetical protein VFS88_03860 [Micavibrio sp.]|nr:hypothetical protein [Micavibrio sp.]